MSKASEMNNLNYYFGGTRGLDTIMLLMDYQGDRHSRPEVRNFVNRFHHLVHGSVEKYKEWCTSTERPKNECWCDNEIN